MLVTMMTCPTELVYERATSLVYARQLPVTSTAHVSELQGPTWSSDTAQIHTSSLFTLLNSSLAISLGLQHLYGDCLSLQARTWPCPYHEQHLRLVIIIWARPLSTHDTAAKSSSESCRISGRPASKQCYGQARIMQQIAQTTMLDLICMHDMAQVPRLAARLAARSLSLTAMWNLLARLLVEAGSIAHVRKPLRLHDGTRHIQ